MKNRANRLTLGFLIFLIIFSSHFSPIFAQNVIPDSLVTIRLQYLKNALEHDKANTNRWWYGWLGGYSAATIGQGAVYLNSNDKSLRQDMALGAATTLLGAAGQFFCPLIPGHEPEKFNSISANTPDEQLKKLAVAEQLLNDCAKREKLARHWKYHALTGAVNLGGGLITWLGFKRNIGAGIGYFALNTAITEAQIWTQPIFAKRAYQKYRLEYLKNTDDLAFVPKAKWYVGANSGGIGVKVVF